MKRIAIALLVLVMIAMVGCGSEKSVETVAPAAVPTTIPETLSPIRFLFPLHRREKGTKEKLCP